MSVSQSPKVVKPLVEVKGLPMHLTELLLREYDAIRDDPRVNHYPERFLRAFVQHHILGNKQFQFPPEFV